MMDVVLPYTNDSHWQDNELRYCLRSLEKNFLNLGEVYIIGSKPTWVRNVTHIRASDNYLDNKGGNIISKLLLACFNPAISDDFLFVSDDQYLLVPMRAQDIQPYYVYDMTGLPLRKGNKFWMQCLRNTRKTLKVEGLTLYNYEPHVPMVINKKKFIQVMKKYDWENILYPTLSLYFNNVLKTHEQLPPNHRIFYDGLEISKHMNFINGKQFLAHSDLGLSWQLQQKIKELFPKKSKFER